MTDSMRLKTVQVKNFRLLRDFCMDFRKDLSLVIGKNNSGKTSLLAVMDKFLSARKDVGVARFNFNDFNIEALDEFKECFDNGTISEENLLSIDLLLTISYSEEDSLENISRFMVDLDPKNNKILLKFRYMFDLQKLSELRKDYGKYLETHENKTIVDYLQKYYANYFITAKYSVDAEDDGNTIKINPEDRLEDLLNFSYIHAKRDISETAKSGRRAIGTLSKLSASYFNKESKIPGKSDAFSLLSQTVELTDEKLTKDVYPKIFKDLLQRTEEFGVKNESKIDIISAIDEARILSDNTIVTHRQLEYLLPEDYNGLGYLNLFTMIFQVEVAIKEFAQAYAPNKKKADINLLFIEEPEAHTHPQLQYIFIRNIKNMLKTACTKEGVNLQTVISTHSSHIVAASDFSDIKYFYRESETSVIAKNLSDLKKEYGVETKEYDFLKQYLTLTSGELFFADKAVLIEGDTERLLLPIMMKKIDHETEKSGVLPLLSQNISIIEVGAYSHIFEKFIDFLGIKTLIITDIDTVDEKDKACRVSTAKKTANSALNSFFKGKTIEEIKKLSSDEKVLKKVEKAWINNTEGLLRVAYQCEEKDGAGEAVIGRSFEEAFIHINRDFINKQRDLMRGLKNREFFDDPKNDAYHLAEHCIGKKTYFALDIIFFSDEKMTNWTIPKYIKEGLLWLQN